MFQSIIYLQLEKVQFECESDGKTHNIEERICVLHHVRYFIFPAETYLEIKI